MGSRFGKLIELGPPVFAVSTFGFMLLFFVFGRWQLALATMVVGWFLLTPLSGVLNQRLHVESSDESGETAAESDPVEELRRRYAEGEIDEVEFERQLETVLATEDTDPETARERLQDSPSVATSDPADLDTGGAADIEDLSDLDLGDATDIEDLSDLDLGGATDDATDTTVSGSRAPDDAGRETERE